VAAARWVQQEILERNPTLDVTVYAIWFRMYPTDRRSAWPGDILTDPRVVHRWDEGKVVGTWYARELDDIRPRVAPGATGLDGPVPVLWDAYLIYKPGATFRAHATALVRWGRTILNTRRTFRDEVAGLPRR